jgi:DNA/RNA-binding domain of Phe-tRNA-synthetase-like protein
MRAPGGGVGAVNHDRITDVYNAVSVRHLVPVGGEDLDRYQGPTRLVRATGDELFDTVREGQPEIAHPAPGEVVWRDDAGVTCRCWNWRQCTRTRVSDATVRALFVLDGVAALGAAGLQAAGDDVMATLTPLHPDARFAARLL